MGLTKANSRVCGRAVDPGLRGAHEGRILRGAEPRKGWGVDADPRSARLKPPHSCRTTSAKMPTSSAILRNRPHFLSFISSSPLLLSLYLGVWVPKRRPAPPRAADSKKKERHRFSPIPLFSARASVSPSTPRTPSGSRTKRSRPQTVRGRSCPPPQPSRPARRLPWCGQLDRAGLHPGALR